MELTCLPPTTPDNQPDTVGDKKKDWVQMDEEDRLVMRQMNQELDSIAEEKTLEDEETIEEDVTKSFISLPDWLVLYFGPFDLCPVTISLLLQIIFRCSYQTVYTVFPPFYLISAI